MLQFRFSGINAAQRRCFAPDDALRSNNWSDFDEEMTRLDAVITDINIDGSDPTFQVRARDGMNWTIELGSHARNRKTGLEDALTTPGDRITVIGHPSHHFGENRIKAVQLTIGDKEFELYHDDPKAGA